MIRGALLASVLIGATPVAAQDPPPAPKAPLKILPAQPGALQPALPIRVSPTVLARYEEEADVLEAQLGVKRAYIKAAQVTVTGAKVKLDRAQKLLESKAITDEEVQLAKLDLEAALAQIGIREAEMKEVEVKLKYAKKRVEDAKAGVRPVAPRVDPKPIDPR